MWLIGFFMTTWIQPFAAGSEASPSQAKPFAVVELFTSEGCSSCPPADRLLSALAEEARPGVFLLAFHVDYWDYLGWRDPFANKAYSQRQRRYARTLEERVYTPQMIVNGHSVFVGSDRAEAQRQIDRALLQKAVVPLRIDAKAADGKVTVRYTVSNLSGRTFLNLAVVERGLVSKVRRGENAGRELGHSNVVRRFERVELNADAQGKTSLDLPSGLKLENAQLIAYAQDPVTLQVQAATAASLVPDE